MASGFPERVMRTVTRHYVVSVSATLCAFVGGVGYAAWCNWGWLHHGESPAATLRNVVLIMASVIALPLAVWRSVVATRQVALQRSGLLNDRYQRGADMLGSETMAVRLGGIYALDQLSWEQPHDYHIQTMRLFVAFVRHPPPEHRDASDVAEPGALPRSRRGEADVRAIIEFFRTRGRRRVEIEKARFYYIDFSGVVLNDVDFGSVQLMKARFVGAQLQGANFGGADLTSANLRAATMTHVDLRAAGLENTDLRDTIGLTQEQLNVAWQNDPVGPVLPHKGPLVWLPRGW